MREGGTFCKYFKTLNSKIDSDIFFASRQSTFLPFLSLNSITDLNVFLFHGISVEDLYSIYGLNIIDIEIRESRKKKLSDLYEQQEKLFDSITCDIKNRENEIFANAKNQRTLLNKYFKQFKPAEDSAFVDFGGGGTALIRLNQLLDNQDLKLGLLFYRHPQSYKHSVEHHLFSFLPLNRKTENALNIISRTPDILEILLNASFSTTKNYESLVNGSVMPSKNNPKTNELNNSKIFGSFSGCRCFL